MGLLYLKAGFILNGELTKGIGAHTVSKQLNLLSRRRSTYK